MKIGDNIIARSAVTGGEFKARLVGLPNEHGGACVVGSHGIKEYAYVVRHAAKGDCPRTTPKDEMPAFLTRSAKR